MIEVSHDDADLFRLETDATYRAGFAVPIVRAFRVVMQRIRSAPQINTLYQFKGQRLEKLKGSRSHEHSMRLNKKWRLIMELSGTPPAERVLIKGIENHYGD